MKTILDCPSCENKSDDCEFACLNKAAALVPDSALASSGVAAPAHVIPHLRYPDGFDPTVSVSDFLELMSLVYFRQLSQARFAGGVYRSLAPFGDLTVRDLVSIVYQEQSK